MMFYRGPLGDTREDPDLAFLRTIADKPADYWAQGGGDSCLEVLGSGERLLFFAHEPHGFFLMMHPDYEVIIQNSQGIETVEHRVGGEPMRVPSCSFVTRDEAYALMVEFVTTGARPGSVQWQDMYELEFDHGFENL